MRILEEVHYGWSQAHATIIAEMAKFVCEMPGDNGSVYRLYVLGKHGWAYRVRSGGAISDVLVFEL